MQYVISFLVVIVPASFAGAGNEVLIRVKGANILANAVQETAAVFQERHPEYVIIVSGGGTSAGLRGLSEKNIELAVALRDATPVEREELVKAGTQAVKFVLGWDGIAVVTNPGNPINDLTQEQCEKIFSGHYSSWAEVGGTETPISLVIPSPAKHETSGSFQKLVLKGAPYPANCRIVPHWKGVISSVSSERGGAGICAARRAYRAGSGIKILGIKETEKSVAALPAVETAYGELYPLRRPITFFWDARSPLHKQIERFATFCKTFGLAVYR